MSVNRTGTIDCDASVCGLFRLTWCIEPKLANLLSTTTQKNSSYLCIMISHINENRYIKKHVFHSAYAQCANYPYCAAGTVQVYIAIFIQVCAPMIVTAMVISNATVFFVFVDSEDAVAI
ncbi:hypothetical protein E2986_10677 [Frieseomelitta varia]|uniref:Uncharacterized protein n=1 Tax=Frieseomelitta varia TaxID=561572 RepID=A0A833WB31_9HYME|nr:hypothetical protein E2986_10677 [Frieseomelitta varia]